MKAAYMINDIDNYWPMSSSPSTPKEAFTKMAFGEIYRNILKEGCKIKVTEITDEGYGMVAYFLRGNGDIVHHRQFLFGFGSSGAYCI